jgi:DNA-binding beta-propeller fold protein YncE
VTLVTRWSAKLLGLDNPHGIALAPSGNLYITDDSQRVTEVDPAGKVLRRWGGPGSKPGQFHFIATDAADPRDVHDNLNVDPAGRVYVSDSGNARVEVFASTGRFLRQFGHYGVGRGQFLLPSSLAVDKDGNVYVCDDDRQALMKFSATGQFVWSVGSSGGDPDLDGHFHLSSIDVHGRLVVVNDDQGRVLYIDQNGRKVDAFGSVPGVARQHVCDATVDAAGTTYLTGCPTGPALVLDRNHRVIGRWYPVSPPLFSPRLAAHRLAYTLGEDGAVMVLRLQPAEG